MQQLLFSVFIFVRDALRVWKVGSHSSGILFWIGFFWCFGDLYYCEVIQAAPLKSLCQESDIVWQTHSCSFVMLFWHILAVLFTCCEFRLVFWGCKAICRPLHVQVCWRTLSSLWWQQGAELCGNSVLMEAVWEGSVVAGGCRIWRQTTPNCQELNSWSWQCQKDREHCKDGSPGFPQV